MSVAETVQFASYGSMSPAELDSFALRLPEQIVNGIREALTQISMIQRNLI